MEYLGNDRNIVRDATVTMTNVVASNAIERTDEDAKVGGGDVTLTGPYTGSADTVIEAKIVDTTITGVPAISAPVFEGVGNGLMTAVSATSGMSAETWTVQLESLGTETKKAEVQFQSATLRAKTAGSGGNAISVTVDQSAIEYAATSYALREQLQEGVNEYFGDHWNFGASQLTPEGNIAAGAPRVKFGDDPQVYRQYREYKGNQFVYGFSPIPVRNVPAGGKVYAVTGSRVITITDGVTPEVYSSITTLYDALNAIRNTSALVEVVGAIVNDGAPQGQAAMDLSVYTQSYAASIIRDGSPTVLAASLGLDVDEDAPTEVLVITKGDGDEWDVRGDVSGVLRRAITNVLYSDGSYEFMIPNPPTDPELHGEIFVEYLPVLRGESEDTPQLCHELVNAHLGRNARNGVWEFTWGPLPDAPCPCDDVIVDGGPSDDCLGLTTQPGGVEVAAAFAVRRNQQLAGFIRDFTRINTRLYTPAANDNDFVNKAGAIFGSALKALTSASAKLNYPAFIVSHPYTADTIIEPPTSNGFLYSIPTAGTSHSVAPTFPTTVGATVTDGAGVVYVNIGKKAVGMWDDEFAGFQADAHVLKALGGIRLSHEWAPLTDIVTAGWGGYMVPLTKNGKFYYAPAGTGTTGATEPTYSSSFTDGTVDFIEAGTYRIDSHVYAAGSILVHPIYGVFWSPLGGTSAATEPDFSVVTGSVPYAGLIEVVPVVDGTVSWEFLGTTRTPDGFSVVAGNSPSAVPASYYARYNSAANAMLAQASLQGNFDSPSSEDGCWAEKPGVDGAFFYSGSEDPGYMQVFTNLYYHSAVPRQIDGQQVAQSTKEFGFAAALSCEGSEKDGDKIRVVIKNVNGVTGGYQSADRFTVFVTHGAPLEMGGGQTGDDTLVWSVTGSVNGRKTDYSLNTVTPAAYSSFGLGFLITQGGVKFALGDTFTFALEGGHFQWRRDGGSWSASIVIAATAALADGLVLNFTGGIPPSWVVNDKWTFAARAINGANNLKQPTDARASWTGSTTITIVPVDQDATRVMIADHTIPSDAVIRVQGSDDNFSTTPLNALIAWAARDITAVIAGTSYAKYRITVDKGGSAQWVWMGEPLEVPMVNGLTDLGELVKGIVMPSFVRRAGMDATVEHTAVSAAGVTAVKDMLIHACTYDARRIGVVTTDGDPGIVQYDGERLIVEDVHKFQPSNTSDSLLSFKLELSAVA